MQSKNRKLKRILSGQQNPTSNSTKVANGYRTVQVITLKTGINLPSKTFDKLKKNKEEDLVAYERAVRNKNKTFEKFIYHE